MARKRKLKGKTSKSRILILCEGSKTEKKYFISLKQFNRNVVENFSLDIEVGSTKKNTPFELVKDVLDRQAKEKDLKNEFDEMWVVFDKDSHPKMHEAFQLAKTNDVKIALSSISFEYWILLHFKKTSKPYGSFSELLPDLREFISDYDKGSTDLYSITKDKIEDAILNAGFLREESKKSNSGQKVYNLNPYVNVDDLILKLLKKKNQYSIGSTFEI